MEEVFVGFLSRSSMTVLFCSAGLVDTDVQTYSGCCGDLVSQQQQKSVLHVAEAETLAQGHLEEADRADRVEGAPLPGFCRLRQAAKGLLPRDALQLWQRNSHCYPTSGDALNSIARRLGKHFQADPITSRENRINLEAKSGDHVPCPEDNALSGQVGDDCSERQQRIRTEGSPGNPYWGRSIRLWNIVELCNRLLSLDVSPTSTTVSAGGSTDDILTMGENKSSGRQEEEMMNRLSGGGSQQEPPSEEQTDKNETLRGSKRYLTTPEGPVRRQRRKSPVTVQEWVASLPSPHVLENSASLNTTGRSGDQQVLPSPTSLLDKISFLR